MKKIIILLILALSLAGCATSLSHSLYSPLDISLDYSKYRVVRLAR